jgi:N-formylglutamate deformylase
LSSENASGFEAGAGGTPLVVSFPHVGTALPPEVAEFMTSAGRAVADTDWNVHKLYGFVRELGAGWVAAGLSRYVIDLNRPPDNSSLYPGQTTTGLCPTESFAGAPLYAAGRPDDGEVARRRARYWQPYHDELKRQLAAAVRRHGYAVLLDAHSIRSLVPRLFPGRLPDVNLGTNGGESCDPALTRQLTSVLAAQSRFTHVLNGRFKGGYITRHYGDPRARVHAVQIELAQSAYMDEERPSFDAADAAPLQNLLRSLIAVLQAFVPAG